MIDSDRGVVAGEGLSKVGGGRSARGSDGSESSCDIRGFVVFSFEMCFAELMRGSGTFPGSVVCDTVVRHCRNGSWSGDLDCSNERRTVLDSIVKADIIIQGLGERALRLDEKLSLRFI